MKKSIRLALALIAVVAAAPNTFAGDSLEVLRTRLAAEKEIHKDVCNLSGLELLWDGTKYVASSYMVVGAGVIAGFAELFEPDEKKAAGTTGSETMAGFGASRERLVSPANGKLKSQDCVDSEKRLAALDLKIRQLEAADVEMNRPRAHAKKKPKIPSKPIVHKLKGHTGENGELKVSKLRAHFIDGKKVTTFSTKNMTAKESAEFMSEKKVSGSKIKSRTVSAF